MREQSQNVPDPPPDKKKKKLGSKEKINLHFSLLFFSIKE